MYLDSNELSQEIIKSQQAGRATEELGRMLILLANGVCGRWKFQLTRDRDDHESDIILACLLAFPRFKEGGNAFNFFTTVARNELFRSWRVGACRKRTLEQLAEAARQQELETQAGVERTARIRNRGVTSR